MRRGHWLKRAAILLAAELVAGSTANAGPIADWFGCDDCPPPVYSPFRYLAPALARLYDCFHGPSLPVYAPDQHPEIPPNDYILKYLCPPATPVQTLIPTPTPPATSVFRY